MRTLYVDKKVEVWRRTYYKVSDDLTNEEFITKLKELSKLDTPTKLKIWMP